MDFNELVLKRQDAAGRYGQIARDMVAGKREDNDETRNELAGIEKELQDLDAKKDLMEKAEALTGETLFKDVAEQTGKSLDQTVNLADQQAEAFKGFLLSSIPPSLGGVPLSEGHAKILNIDGGASGRGGVTIPTMVEARLVERLRAVSPLRRLATVMSSATGRNTSVPAENDTGNEGEILPEGDVDVETPAAKAGVQGRTFTNVPLAFDVYDSKRVGVRREFLQDTAAPQIVARMSTILGTRIGRVQAKAFAWGDDGTNGVSNCSNGGYRESSTTQVGNQVLVAGTNPTGDGGKNQTITFQEWITAMVAAIDPAYWMSADFMDQSGGGQLVNSFGPGLSMLVNQTVLGEIMSLRSTDGIPVFQPSQNVVGGSPGRLLGVNLFVDPTLASRGTSQTVALFGDCSTLEIRDATGMQFWVVGDDSFNIERNMISYWARQRMGFAFVTGGDGLKKLVTAA